MRPAYTARDAHEGVELPPFNEQSACVKCDSQDVNAYYTEPCKLLGCASVNCAAEHIRRTCRRCGFVWAEAPLTSVARLSGEGEGT